MHGYTFTETQYQTHGYIHTQARGNATASGLSPSTCLLFSLSLDNAHFSLLLSVLVSFPLTAQNKSGARWKQVKSPQFFYSSQKAWGDGDAAQSLDHLEQPGRRTLEWESKHLQPQLGSGYLPSVPAVIHYPPKDGCVGALLCCLTAPQHTCTPTTTFLWYFRALWPFCCWSLPMQAPWCFN